MSPRNTHNRLLDHEQTDLDTNVVLDGALSAPASTSSGDTVHQALEDLNGAIGSSGGGPVDLITGNDSTFAASLGAWTNTGGTMTRDTGVKLLGFTASLKHVTTTTGQYVELALGGTFKANQQYWFVALFENTIGTDSVDLTLGLIGTDASTQTITVGGTDFQCVAVPWTPTADRTGVKVRVEVPGARTYYIGWAKAFLSIGPPILINDVSGTGTNVYIPQRTSGYLSLGPHTNGGFNGLQFAYDGTIQITSPTGAVGLSIFPNNFYQWAEHTPGDLAGKGIEIEAGTDYVGLFISEKNSTTVQLYADSSSGYHIELRDRNSIGWETNDGTSITPLANLHYLKHGTADPSAGGGVASAIGSLYGRNNSGAGELWLKTGAGNTAWTQITVP